MSRDAQDKKQQLNFELYKFKDTFKLIEFKQSNGYVRTCGKMNGGIFDVNKLTEAHRFYTSHILTT